MSKLLEHIRAMQAMATAYITPEPYVDRDGKRSDEHNGEKQGVRDNLFAGDMLWMLDGPEQREAERHHGSDMDAMDEARALSERNAVLRSDADRAIKRVAEERVIQNDLRSRLFDSELAYAKLRGYLDRVEDERPPRMVEQQRERFSAGIPDGTTGTDYGGGWRNGDAHRDPKWFHR